MRVRGSYIGGELGTPKNRERRDVDLISDMVELLGWWRGEHAVSARPDTLVFPAERRSGFLSPSTLLRRELYPAMKRTGVPRAGPTQERRTFHSFRHTFAKRALESGAQITWLSRHLGHSSLKVSTDIDGHWERAERKLQAAKMAVRVGNAAPGSALVSWHARLRGGRFGSLEPGASAKLLERLVRLFEQRGSLVEPVLHE